MSKISKILGVAALCIGAVAVALASITSNEDGDTDENEYSDDIDDSDSNDFSVGKKKEYKGYIPVGCSACGGPYPDCMSSCPIYDD